MSGDYMAEVSSLEALIGGSFPTTLSKLSSTSLEIPTNSDFRFLYTSDEFRRPIDEIAQSSQCVLETIGERKSIRFRGGIDGDDSYDWLVNVNNTILETIDDSIDEYKGNRKKEEDSMKLAEKFARHGKAKVSFHMPTIKKPQDEYNILVNNANKPFEHVLLERSDDGLHYIHPLEKLSVMDFVDKDLSEMKPVNPLPLEGTPFKLVEEVKDLEDLAAKLQSVEEFAVDLEHNQYRSFQGLTCLMQISTRTEDYIVDTFKLWDHIGPYLREVFKDPKKKKVMHGADRDIIWLQRDFGIYVCNLFDTGQASRVLKLERNSLEFLLKHYCGVAANKQCITIQSLSTFVLLHSHLLTLSSISVSLIACRYQNADWRIRPLPDVMTRYAREDTHYLLYIYDVMRIDLLTMAKEDEQSDSPLIEVYKRSYDVCTQLYEKELLTGDSYLHVYGVQAANFNAVQLSIVAGLFEWRDPIARADDESTGYVLPNKTLLDIAKEMPINVGKLRRVLKAKHPYIERNIDAVVSVIRRSMQNAAAFEPVVQSLNEGRPGTAFKKNLERIEETGTEAIASSPSKFCVEVSKKQSSGFEALPSKRKFGSENKVKEEVKVSKSKPNEVFVKNIETIEETGIEAIASSPSFFVDVSKKQNCGFGALRSKRKFGSDNKVKEEVKVSKSIPDEVIILMDDDDDESDEQASETDDAVLETPFKGSPSLSQKAKTCDTEIIVLDDDDESENDSEGSEDEEINKRIEKQSRFMSLKRGFLNI